MAEVVYVVRPPSKAWVEYLVDGVWHKEAATFEVMPDGVRVDVPAHATRGTAVRAWVEEGEVVMSSGTIAVSNFDPAGNSNSGPLGG